MSTTANDILRTYQRSISILASLPLTVTFGSCCLVCIPTTMFIASIFPYIDNEKGLLRRSSSRSNIDNKTLFLLAVQVIPIFVLATWSMGFLINRTAHCWFSNKGGGGGGGGSSGRKNYNNNKPSPSSSSLGLKFASFQKNQAHDFLYPMLVYVFISILFVLAMIGFTIYWDDGLSASSSFIDAIVILLGNIFGWICILYLYSTIILSGPIIVLHRTSTIQAMKGSYNLARDEGIRWQLLTLIISFIVITGLLNFILSFVLSILLGNGDSSSSSSSTTSRSGSSSSSSSSSVLSYSIQFNSLVLLLLPLYSR